MKRAAVFIIIGCMLLASSAVLFIYNEVGSFRAAEESMEILSSLEEEMLSDTPGTIDEYEGVMPTRLVNGINMVGVVSVPSVGIEIPVAAEWSYKNLKKSACRYSGTAKNGRLGKAEMGDEVQFLDVNGTLYVYKITDKEILGKYELDRLTDNDSDLTLFTCTYGGKKRVVVRCQKQQDKE